MPLEPKKKYRTTEIGIDAEDLAIVVSYECETIMFTPSGDVQSTEKTNHQKRITIKSIDQNTDVKRLAEEVIGKCKLISTSKQQYVQDLLEQLRRQAKNNVTRDEGQRREMHENRQQARPRVPARMADLESYIEKFYDDNAALQIEAARMILELARNPSNLDDLSNETTLLEILTRLSSEGKDIDLTSLVVEIFSCFAHYSKFHALVLEKKVGSKCIALIDREMKRRGVLDTDLANAKLNLGNGRIDPTVAAKKYGLVKQNFDAMKQKQEYLLCACFHLLLNLAEDVDVQRKMKNLNIVAYLVAVLDAELPDLLLVVLTFLKKLSVYKENKNEMKKSNIADKLGRFLPYNGDPNVTSLAVRLMFNLSFDSVIRGDVIKAGYVPRLIQLLKSQQSLQQSILKLLYHLSLDERAQTGFSFAEVFSLLIQMVLNTKESVGREVLALAANLSTQQSNAEAIAGRKDSIAQMIRMVQLQQHKDPLLMKLLKNLSVHEGEAIKKPFVDAIDSLVKMAMNSSLSPEFRLEVLGTLGNLVVESIDWKSLVERYGLIQFLSKLLASGEDDLLPEAVILVGTIAQDSACSAIVLESNLPGTIINLLYQKQDDDEVILQCVYTLFRLMQLPGDKEVLLKPNAFDLLLKLLYGKTPEITKMVSLALDLFIEFKPDLAQKMRQAKFEMYNSQWLSLARSEGGGGGGGMYRQRSSSTTTSAGGYVHSNGDDDGDEDDAYY